MVSRDDTRRTPVAEEKARKALWLFSVPIVALVLGFAGGVVILLWGLVTPFFIVLPLALGSSALLAAIGASWAGTFLATDHTRSRLLRTVLASEVVAGVLAIVFLAAPVLFPAAFLPPISLFAIAVIFIATGASAATWRFRSPAERADGKVFALLALSALVLFVTIAGLTGLLGIFGIWEWTAMLLVSSVDLSAVALSVILIRRRRREWEGQIAKDAVVTLGLVGLPAPVFFGAYYLAFVFNLTSG